MKGIARKVLSDVVGSFRPLAVMAHYPMPIFCIFYGGLRVTAPMLQSLGGPQGVQDCCSLGASCKGLHLPKAFVRRMKIIYPGYQQR